MYNLELLNKEIAMSVLHLEPIEMVLKSRGVSRSTLEAEIKDHCFPQPVKISLRKRAWPTDEVEKMMRFYLSFKDLMRTYQTLLLLPLTIYRLH